MIFLNSASSAAALVFYLPGVCTHTNNEGRPESGIFFNVQYVNDATFFYAEACIFCNCSKAIIDIFILLHCILVLSY